MEKKHHYTYRVTNKKNRKYYLGKHSTNDIDDGYLGSGVSLKKDIEEFGINNFEKEIIEFFETEQKAYYAEAVLIEETDIKDDKCYNQRIGGSGSRIGRMDKCSVDLREKTKRKKFIDSIDNAKIYKFDMMGKLSAVYTNVHTAAAANGFKAERNKMAIRWCASERNLANRKYSGWYWSFTKEIPEKCYLPGEFIYWKQQQKTKRKRKRATPQEKLEKLWKS